MPTIEDRIVALEAAQATRENRNKNLCVIICEGEEPSDAEIAIADQHTGMSPVIFVNYVTPRPRPTEQAMPT